MFIYSNALAGTRWMLTGQPERFVYCIGYHSNAAMCLNCALLFSNTTVVRN